MSISLITSNSVAGTIDVNSFTGSITAATGDIIEVILQYRDTSSVVFNPPTWNGQTFTEVAPRKLGPGFYQHRLAIKVTTGGTFPINGATVGGTYTVLNWSYNVWRSSTTSFITMPFRAYTENLYNSGTYAAPTIVLGLLTNEVMSVALTTPNWDTGFGTGTSTFTVGGGDTLINGVTSTYVTAVKHLYTAYATGNGAVTSTFTEVGSQHPMYLHTAVILFEGTAPDSTPNGFSFTAVTNSLPSTVNTSNSITVAGIDGGALLTSISVTGGTYSINGGAYTAAPGTTKLGDVITVQVVASASYSTGASATLSIGGVTGTFTATTRAAITAPTAFSFTAATNVVLSSTQTSNSITVLGIDGGTVTTAISITGGTYSVNGGAYTSAAGNVKLNDVITVQVVASASASTAVSATLTIGGVSATYTATTVALAGFTIPAIPYDAASGKFSSRAGAAGSKIIANSFVFVSFDKLTAGQSVVSTANDPGSVAGRRFSSVLGNLGFAAGYGVQGTTAVKMPGATSSCAISIKAGSDGNQGGTTGAGTGSWGGSIAFPSAIPEGGEIWYGQYCYIPSNFSWAGVTPSTQDMIKFLRLNTTKLVGRIEHYVVNTSFFGGSSPYNAQEGWLMANEFSTISSSQVGKKSSAIMTPGSWSWVEFYIKAASDGNNAIRRLWVNGVLHFEYVGTAAKFRTPAGTYSTATLSSPIKTISDGTDGIADVMHGTYWNGNATQDQTYYIQKIVGHNNPAEIYAVDAFGNKMMGAQ